MFTHFSHIYLKKICRELDELEHSKYKLTFLISFGSKPKLKDRSNSLVWKMIKCGNDFFLKEFKITKWLRRWSFLFQNCSNQQNEKMIKSDGHGAIPNEIIDLGSGHERFLTLQAVRISIVSFLMSAHYTTYGELLGKVLPESHQVSVELKLPICRQCSRQRNTLNYTTVKQ